MNPTQHWTIQRVTAILLLPLSLWLFAFLKLSFHANYFEITQWLSAPLNKIALIAWLFVVCLHSAIGLQVVFEDYISNRATQVTAIWAAKAFFSGLALACFVLLLQN